MTLTDLGYTSDFENHRRQAGLAEFATGRVITEHKERYIISTGEKEYEGEILGSLRYSAASPADFPAVGDWVAIAVYDEDKALIHAILPRTSILARQAVGTKGERQIIAANIDAAFIIQAVDRDFSINRIERYLTICNSSNIKPVIILNKIDLVEATTLSQMVATIQQRLENVPVFAISNKSREGFEALTVMIEKGKTYCLLGSSGVGKSTLLNTLAGEEIMQTEAISEHTERGRHITTHRELRVLENGGILIDNPGMRELGIADSTQGLEETFEAIVAFAKHCKFKDCQHINELGCGVLAALERGELSHSSYENYLKLVREKEHYESTVAEKRQKDKDFGKMIKQVMKNKRSRKF